MLPVVHLTILPRLKASVAIVTLLPRLVEYLHMYTGQADTGWMEYLCEIAHAWAHLKLWPHDVEGKIFIEHHFAVLSFKLIHHAFQHVTVVCLL